MALTKPTIKKMIESGSIIISDFVDYRLQGASYDVTLGENYYSVKPNQAGIGIHNPLSQESTERLWGKDNSDAKQAMPFEKLVKMFGSEIDEESLNAYPPETKVILLQPGELILAHTVEFIGSNDPLITPDMSAKSSTGRNGITVCKCAGWGDPGYFNRWTMEIQNEFTDRKIILTVGMEIAQIKFVMDSVLKISDAKILYGNSGKYQKGQSLEELQKSWEPLMMLPRMYKNREKLFEKQAVKL